MPVNRDIITLIQNCTSSTTTPPTFLPLHLTRGLSPSDILIISSMLNTGTLDI